MSQISGYKRSLSHANSIVVESNMPKFGVASEHEEELAEVGIEIIKYKIYKNVTTFRNGLVLET